MAVKQITKDDFKKEVLEDKGVVFVDFYADWCTPCKLTQPIINEISQEIEGVKFVKINVDENPDLASQYAIFSIPTFLIFKDGKIKSQTVGVKSKEVFIEEIRKATQGN